MKYLLSKKIFENKFEGYTIRELYSGLASGKIKIKECLHNSISRKGVFHELPLEYFKDCLEEYDRCEESQKSRGIPDSLSSVYSEIRNRKHMPGELVTDNFVSTMDGYYCWDCGQRLRPLLISENEVALINPTIYHKTTKNDKVKFNISNIPNCPIGDTDIKDKIVTEIKISSGNLIISNYFHNKEINEMPTYNCINDLMGRYKLAKYLESKDIGYGQMSNMSLTVWRKLDGSEILLTDSFIYDEESHEETEFNYEGYENLGEMCLDVWRWMCADKETLDKYNESIPKNSIEAKVKPGKWQIEHYYDVVGDRPDGIYSKMFLNV